MLMLQVDEFMLIFCIIDTVACRWATESIAIGPMSWFGVVVEIDEIVEKSMVKLVFFRDVHFSKIGDCLGRRKSG
jgi:hypothetical protein